MSQSSSFDDRLSVHPWRRLIKEICDDVTAYDMRTLVFLAKEQVGLQYSHLAQDGNIYEFFASLELVYGEELVADLVENLLECAQLHDQFGVKFADRIRAYKEARREYLVKCQEKGVYKDPNFVGRESMLKEILACLEPGCSYKGVIVCGLGGMGKSSLATEVSFRLTHRQPSWAIVRLNLREKAELSDLLHDLVTSLDEEYVGLDMDVTILTLKLRNILQGTFVDRRLIVLDDVDGLCDGAAKMDIFCTFLTDLLRDMDTLVDTCQTRLLLTVREKLGREIRSGKQTRLTGQLREFELTGLSLDHSADLLRKCTNQDIAESEEIGGLCGGSPMAVRLVAGLLSEGQAAKHIVTWLRHDTHTVCTVGPQLQMENCFRKVFTSLRGSDTSHNLQHVFLKLSLFKTAPFDIEAAIAVAGDQGDSKTNNICKWRKRKQEPRACVVSDIQKACMMTNFLALKMKHLIEFVDSPGHGKRVKQFSLHPLVWRYHEAVADRQTDETDTLRNQYCHGKWQFLRYFSRVIDDCARDQDLDPLRAQRCLVQNSVHIQTFYHIILNDCLSVDEYVIDDRRNKPKKMLIENHFWKVALLVLSPHSRKLFAAKQAEHALKANQLYRYISWRCKQVEYLLEQDRVELAEDQIQHAESILINLCSELGVVKYCGSGDDLQHAHVGRAHAKFIEREVSEEIIPAVAMYHVVRGRIYRQRRLYDQALDSLEVAKHLFKGDEIRNVVQTKTGSQKLYNSRYYLSDLANVVNLVGCVHFDMKQLDKSRQCHQDAYDIIFKLTDYQNCHIDIPEYLTNIGICSHQLALSTNDESEKKKYFKAALHKYNQSLCIDKQLKRDMFRCHSKTLRHRADIHYHQGELQSALHDAKESLSVLQRLVVAPNVDLTCAYGEVAHIAFKLGREMANKELAYFKESLRHYDHVRIHIKCGGLPMDHQDYQRYKAEHRCLLQKLDYPSHIVEKRMKTYQEFEDGKFSNDISAVRRHDLNFDPHELLRTAQAKGENLVLSDTNPEQTTPQEMADVAVDKGLVTNEHATVVMDSEGVVTKRSGADVDIDKGLVANEEATIVMDMKVVDNKPRGADVAVDKRLATNEQVTIVMDTKASADVAVDQDLPTSEISTKVILSCSNVPCGNSDESDHNSHPECCTSDQTCPQGSSRHSDRDPEQHSKLKSQDNALTMIAKLLTLSSRSFAENRFIPADASDESEQSREPARKRARLDPGVDRSHSED